MAGTRPSRHTIAFSYGAPGSRPGQSFSDESISALRPLNPPTALAQ